MAYAPNIQSYTVQSSDVIGDMRVNVLEPNTNRVVWYKERYLGEDEIIEHVWDNQTSTLCWTIHKPKRGWYIRLRAPSFPPGAFVPLMPVPRSAPHYVDAAMSFACRTSARSSRQESTVASPSTATLLDGDGASTSSVHSYPPTPPPQFVVQPPSPTAAIHGKQDASLPPRRATSAAIPHISPFLLSPSTSAPLPQSSSIFVRALSVLRNNQPATYSNSFTLCSIEDSPPDPPSTTQSPIIPADSSLPIHPNKSLMVPAPTPLLAFHDRTPFLSISSLTGVLEINRAEESTLGVDTSFWVAIALTYLEFLEERESYLAASND